MPDVSIDMLEAVEQQKSGYPDRWSENLQVDSMVQKIDALAGILTGDATYCYRDTRLSPWDKPEHDNG